MFVFCFLFINRNYVCLACEQSVIQRNETEIKSKWYFSYLFIYLLIFLMIWYFCKKYYMDNNNNKKTKNKYHKGFLKNL